MWALIAWLGLLMAAPANDSCSTATVVSALPFSDSLSTVEATSGGEDPTPSGGSMGHTVWYKWVATFSGRVLVTTVKSDEAIDFALAVFTGTCGALSEVAYNDDVAPQTWAGTGVRLPAETAFQAVQGTTYYIMVGSDDTEPGGDLVFRMWGETATGTPTLRQQKTFTSSFSSITEEDNLGNYWYPGVGASYDNSVPHVQVFLFYAYNVTGGAMTIAGRSFDSNPLNGSLCVMLRFINDASFVRDVLLEFINVSTVRPLQAKAVYESAASGITNHTHSGGGWESDPNLPEAVWPAGSSGPALFIATNISQAAETASTPSGFTDLAFNTTTHRGYYKVSGSAESPTASFTTADAGQVAAGLWVFAAPSASVESPPTDESTPSCCTKIDTPTSPGDTTPGALPPPSPYIPLPPWTSGECPGLGTYLTAGNPTEPESWSL